MSQQELYMFEFFVNMKPIVRRLYLLHCPKENFSVTVFSTLSVGILQWLRIFPRKNLRGTED